MARSYDLLVGLRLWGAVCGLGQSANNRASGQVDLEGIMREALGVTQQQIGGTLERVGSRSLSIQRGLGGCIPPGLVATPPRANRAWRMVSPSISRPTATDTKAKA